MIVIEIFKTNISRSRSDAAAHGERSKFIKSELRVTGKKSLKRSMVTKKLVIIHCVAMLMLFIHVQCDYKSIRSHGRDFLSNHRVVDPLSGHQLNKSSNAGFVFP